MLGHKLTYANTPSTTGFLNVGTTPFGRDKPVWKPVLCTARCLAASLASNHQMLVAPFPCDNRKCFQTLSNIPFGDKITPRWKPVIWQLRINLGQAMPGEEHGPQVKESRKVYYGSNSSSAIPSYWTLGTWLRSCESTLFCKTGILNLPKRTTESTKKME